MTPWIVWLLIAGFFFVAEMVTVGFLVFWIGVGALLACLVSLVVPSVLVQVIVWVVSSTLLMIYTRPIINKYIKVKDIPTNVYTLNGKKGIVIEEINPTTGKGQIKVVGEIWSAICDENIVIPKDSEVEIVFVLTEFVVFVLVVVLVFVVVSVWGLLGSFVFWFSFVLFWELLLILACLVELFLLFLLLSISSSFSFFISIYNLNNFYA